MAEFPALPLWTDAYLGDTTHLSTLEHGAYLLLLMTAWRSKTCSLPDNDGLLAKYTRLTPAQWRRIRPILEPFFSKENGHLIQRRLRDELDAVRQKSKRQSTNSKARWLKNKETSDATGIPREYHNDPPTPLPTPLPKESPLPPTSANNNIHIRGILNGIGKGGFDILTIISDKALDQARNNAQGWDMNELAKIYNDGRPERGYPDDPNYAFPAWCKKYTKGKSP